MKLLKNLFILCLIATSITFIGCGEDTADCDGKTCENGETLNTTTCECDSDVTVEVTEVSENITSNQTWTSDKTYVLTSRIAVEDGSTLTIEPGTVIKGEAGSGPNATALIIARGAKLMAEGTADRPIIFTSIADKIESGVIESPNLDVALNGLWGGVIILGKAPISANADVVQVDGIPPSDINGLYGGTILDDDSGVIRYVSIRHGGADIGEGNEINGLTLGGVGNETTIEYVEVVSNVDDGIEFFGGSVNAKHCLVWGQGDDAFDCDQAWTGTLDNYVGIMGEASDHALELDGPEGARLGSFTLKNGTIKGYNANGTDGGEYIDFRDGVTCTIENTYFFNFSDNSDVELDDEEVSAEWIQSTLDVVNLEFDVSHLNAGNTTIKTIFVDQSEEADAFSTRAPSATITTSPTVGADLTKFSSWTLASVKGELNF